jgi:N-acetylneuraminate synthase
MAVELSNFKKCYLIAEIGTGHNGSLNKAQDLIKAAAESGADCAKFQMVIADEIIHPNAGLVPLPGGNINLYQRFKELECPEDFYAQLIAYCRKLKIDFLCTPFGIRSAEILNNLGASLFKVASPELNHYPLLKKIAAFKLPVILSTGVSLLSDIESALSIINADVALLHCITAYPAPEEEYNLRLIKSLHKIFGCPVGLSDHSLDPILLPTLAISMGAKIIEKHFTLNKNDPGLDDPIAITPDEFQRLVKAVREAERCSSETVINQMQDEYSKTRIETILGNGVKHLAKSEKNNYGRTNRSIHALTQINTGEALTPDNMAILRTEKVLKPGLSPQFFDLLSGKKAQKTIAAGDGINWEDLLIY